jgi:hypothetical protein
LRKQPLYLLLGKPMHFVKDFSRRHRSLLPVHLSRFSPKNFGTGQAGIAEKAQLGKIKNLRPLNHERTEPIHTDRMNWFSSKSPSASQVICSESGAVTYDSVSVFLRTRMRPPGRQRAGQSFALCIPSLTDAAAGPGPPGSGAQTGTSVSLLSRTWMRPLGRQRAGHKLALPRPFSHGRDCGPRPARLAGDGGHHVHRFILC